MKPPEIVVQWHLYSQEYSWLWRAQSPTQDSWGTWHIHAKYHCWARNSHSKSGCSSRVTSGAIADAATFSHNYACTYQPPRRQDQLITRSSVFFLRILATIVFYATMVVLENPIELNKAETIKFLLHKGVDTDWEGSLSRPGSEGLVPRFSNWISRSSFESWVS